MNFKEAAKKLLQVIEEIHAEGSHIIGERWALYPKMKGLADQGDLVGMVAYFEACKASPKGRRVREKLEARGKKSLESEERRFLEIAVPPICQMVIDGRQEWLTSAYAGHRKLLENAFEQHRDSVARALKGRVTRDTQAMATRASKLPLMILRNSPLPEVRTCLADVAQCYLYGQFRAAILLSRAALEAALRGRLPPMDQPDRLARVIEECRKRKILDERERVVAEHIKRSGDSVAHPPGDRVAYRPIDEEGRATEVLIKLRGLIEHLYLKA